MNIHCNSIASCYCRRPVYANFHVANWQIFDVPGKTFPMGKTVRALGLTLTVLDKAGLLSPKFLLKLC